MSDAGDEERLRGNERRDCERRSREPRGGPGREVDARDRGRNEGRTSSAGFIVRDRTSRVRTCWRVCPGRREREQPPCCLSTWRSHFWGTRFEKFNGGFRPISRVCEPSSRWPIRFRQGSAIITPTRQYGRGAIPAFIDGDRDDDERGAGRRGRGWDRQIRPRIFRGGIRGPESTTSAGSARPGESRASSPVQAGVVDFGVGDPLLLRRPTASRAAVLGDPSGCVGARWEVRIESRDRAPEWRSCARREGENRRRGRRGCGQGGCRRGRGRWKRRRGG